MTENNELIRLSAAALAEKLAAREITAVEVTQALPGPHRRRRRQGPRLPARQRRRGARRRRRSGRDPRRRRCRRRRAPRPRRRADRRQGPHRHDRPAHHGRLEDPRRLAQPLRRHRRRAPARRQDADPGQDQPRRIRDGLLHRALRLRPHAQPVGPGPHPRRFRRRLRCRRRGLRSPAGPRHRHRRVHPPARRRHRHGRRQAHLRRRLPLRRHRHGLLAGPDRPGLPHRARLGPAAPGDRRARPARLHLAAGPARGPRGRGPDRQRRGHEDRHHQGAPRRGLPGRRREPLQRIPRAAQGRGRRDRRGLLPQLQVRPGRLLPDHAVRGVLQPGQVRRRPLRPAGPARTRDR